MILSTKHKLCFMSPPKTGCGFRESMFVYQDLGFDIWSKTSLPKDRHCTLKEAVKVYNLMDFNKFKIICFVRNPWERYISWMKMLEGSDVYLHDFEEAPLEACVPNKNKFIEKQNTKKTKYSSLKHLIEKSHSLDEYFDYNNIDVEVVDFKDQNAYLKKIEKIFGLNLNIQNNVKPATKKYERYYNCELKNMVYKKEEKVIKLMNYKF